VLLSFEELSPVGRIEIFVPIIVIREGPVIVKGFIFIVGMI
jgi:hypothetical protein